MSAAVGLTVILGWWIYDLSFQWASLVDFRFGWLVVILIAFLVWERWPTRPTDDTPSSPWLPSILAVIALPIVLAAELYKIGVARAPAGSFVLSIGCFLFILAWILATLGPRTLKHFLFPIAFLFLAVPLPKLIWNPIIFSLQSMIASINVEALSIFGIPAEREGHIIRMGQTLVGVDEACSGIRSLQSSLMAALFVGDLTIRRAGIRVGFLVCGALLAILGNFLRSFYLSWLAFHQGTDRLKAMHDTAGWSVLVFTFVGVCVLSIIVSKIDKRIEELSKHHAASQEDEAPAAQEKETA